MKNVKVRNMRVREDTLDIVWNKRSKEKFPYNKLSLTDYLHYILGGSFDTS